VLQASEALAEAHAFGVVHRDLKPSNLFCIEGADGRPCIKVLDFGISKMTAADGSGEMSMTRTAAVMGTPYYMSPEQLRASRDVDARSDIWAMGVLLYELTSGCVPFDGQSISDVSIKIATETPAALGTLRPDVPAGFEAVIARCLEKDRRKRYASVGELARDLVTYAPAHARRSVDAIGRTLKASSSPVVNGPQPAAILTETLAIPAASAGGAAVASPGGGAPAAPGTFRALGRTTGNATRDATGAATARRTTTLLAGAVGIALLVGIAGTMALRSRSTSLSSAIAPERPSAAAAPLPAPPPALKEQQTAAETVGTATIAPLGEPALAPSTADAVPLAPSVPSARAARKADTKPSPHPSIHPAEPPMAPHAPPSPDDPDPFSKLTPK
jgi:serine/threonine-protein kinase